MRFYIFIVMSFSFGLSSCAVDQESQLSLVNGKLDKDGRFPSVVQSAVKISENANGFVEASCTASVVSDSVVLTAAHCLTVADKDPTKAIDGELLANNDPFGSNDGMLSLTGNYYSNNRTFTSNGIGPTPAVSADIKFDGKRIKGGKVVLHPLYTGNSGPDVAVIVFEKGALKKFKPMRIASGASMYPKEGLDVVIVGFGKTDQFDEKSGGEKRFGTNTLTRVGDNLDFVGQTRSTGTGGSEFKSELGTDVFNSQGDSGGPMISDAGSSKGMIIGVSSTQNTVQAGDVRGEGHYTNLLEESVEKFLKQYVKTDESDFEDDDRSDQNDREDRSPESDLNRKEDSEKSRNQINGQDLPPEYLDPSTNYSNSYTYNRN